MGCLHCLFRADPWSGVNFGNGIDAKHCAHVANLLQKWVIENTRFGIPVLLTEECPHGHMALDGTVSPVNLAVGCTFNPSLYAQSCQFTAMQLAASGTSLGLVSCLDVFRDPHWGRCEECYGEDPVTFLPTY